MPQCRTAKKHDYKNCDPNSQYKAANVSKINTYGQRLLYIDLGFDSALPFIFTIAEVEQCIIGVDFLTHHDISVRPRTKQLTHAESGSTVIAKGINTANISPLCENTDNTPDYVVKLLSQYPAIGSDISNDTPIKHDVVHRIQVDDSQRPLSTRPRRLGPDVGEAAYSTGQTCLSFIKLGITLL